MHRLTDNITHNRWDNSLPPILSISSGDTVTLDVRDASDRQVTPESKLADMAKVDLSRIHPLTGPIYVERAEPGDVLQIDVVEVKHRGWGWTFFRPGGLGLLSQEMQEPYLKLWDLAEDWTEFMPRIRIPVQPFCGIIGVALATPGEFRTIPPRENGGNIDIKHLTKGSTVFLPVLARGALLSIGDCHAAQGDGEVCGTAIEGPMSVTLRVLVRRGLNITELQFSTQAPLESKIGAKGYYVTTGFSPDIFEAAKKATRFMIQHLVDNYSLSPAKAYILCSVAVDLRISEIVNTPNWIVSAYLPNAIFS